MHKKELHFSKKANKIDKVSERIMLNLLRNNIKA